MLQIHLKTALRQLWQKRLYSGINIIGLATGITCLLFALLYWKDEHGYDQFHKTNPHLYRITTTITDRQGKQTTAGGTGQVQGPVFSAEVPEIADYVRVFGGDIFNEVRSGGKTLKLRPLFVDPSFFEVFTFNLVQGNKTKALKDVNGVVLTERTARKLFNRTDVVGEMLNMDGDPSFEKLGKPILITGVVKDPPAQSSIQFDLLLTFSFLHLSFQDQNWLNAYLGTFIVLRPDADKNAVLKKFNRIYDRYAQKQVGNNDFDIYGFDPRIRYGLQPITEIHLNPLGMMTGNNESGVVNGSNPLYSYIIMGISLFVLAMATINLITIATGNSLGRAKEVGIRKIMGGNRRQIMLHFLAETFLLCLAALLLSMILLHTVLPWINGISGKQLLFADMADAGFLLYAGMVLIIVMLLSGLYPSFILSRFKPAEVLYNRQKLSGRQGFGRSLVVLQFSLAVFLLITTLVYYQQMQYIRNKNLGYNPNGIIRTALAGNRDPQNVMHFLRNGLAKEPSIMQVSFGDDGYKEKVTVDGRPLEVQYKNIDEHFLATLQIGLKTGRNLSPAFVSDATEGTLVNETFLKVSGLADPVGKRIKVTTDDSTFKTIRGVVKDFHFGSLREPILPMVLFMKPVPDGGMWVKFKNDKQQEAMAAVERVYKQAMPDAAYEFQFLDELNARQYLQEARWQQVVSIATIISLIVCGLGLFGLAHLSAQQRTKEIGIRKTLGASVRQIVALLSGSFLKLVLLAFLIAIPASWLVMQRWLQDFAYRIQLGPFIFLLAGLLAVTVAFVAISIHTLKAAMANPVESLRNE